ncbi:hypothetical protein LCGC14_2715160, partial [marine sediment metagenome]
MNAPSFEGLRRGVPVAGENG